ncbi:mannose 6-phosphate receptor domain-containing protein [Pluteus cervinus]|uniref:Mannose 6-phosphate receptor domain-containing protein n=1 Tax=Pluteus cervinus TaxID=181527 RepID=A0ACD3AVS4_9AGAR|nr:mannose 6-phosphate receptor domain-containing protein [Pluteus cervinus]
MKMRVSSLTLTLLLGASAAFAEDKLCTTYDGNKFYDLNPLRGSKDYEFKTPSGHRLVLNICGRIWTETFGLKDLDAAQIGGFLRRDHGDVSIGALNTTVVVQDSHPRLYLLDGSPCTGGSDSNAPRISTVIDFVCDTSVFGTGKPRLVASFPPYDDEKACGFAIEWRTQFACPTSGGAWGVIAILAVLTLSLLVIYTILGTLYNRYVLNLRGFDQIPQFSIESMRYHATEAWDWTKDIITAYRANGGFSGYRGFGNDSYQPTPTSPSRPTSGQEPRNPGGFIRPRPTAATNPVSHHAQSQADPELGKVPDSHNPSGFLRPQFSQAPRPTGPMTVRGLETNPVSHFTQSQSQLQPSGSPTTSHISSSASPRPLSASPLPPLPQHQPTFSVSAVPTGSSAPAPAGGQTQAQPQAQPKSRAFGVGSDEDDEDDYDEYEDEGEDEDGNENAPLAGQGGGSGKPPPPPKDGGGRQPGGAIRI